MALPQLNVPKYDLSIPSTGVVVKYRPYLVKEEKLLMIALESQDEKQMTMAVTDIVDSCTMNQLKMHSLTMFDIEYIFTKLRSKSVGETAKVKLPCTKCEEKNSVDIDLEMVQVTEKPDTKIQLTEDTGLIMKFPSLSDYQDVQNSDASNVDKIFAIIVSSIDSIYSGDEMFDTSSHSKKELLDFVESLSAEQFKKVQVFLDAMPAVYINALFECEGCGEHNEIELKGLANFFG
jgi:hypothetical protein